MHPGGSTKAVMWQCKNSPDPLENSLSLTIWKLAWLGDIKDNLLWRPLFVLHPGSSQLALGWLRVAPFLSSLLGLWAHLKKKKLLLCCALRFGWHVGIFIHVNAGWDWKSSKSEATHLFFYLKKGRLTPMTTTVNFTCVDIPPVYSERVSWLLQSFY